MNGEAQPGTTRRFAAIAGALIACLALAPEPVHAEPHSAPVQIVAVRSYSNGSASTDVAYITTTANSVCGGSYFSIPLGTPAGQAMLSTALTALSSGRSVTIEVSNSTGCTVVASGTAQLQSIVILASGYSGPY